MKKTLFLLIFNAVAFISFGQCFITGPSQFTVGQTVVYSIPTGTAQCNECYDWDINNTNSSISGNVQIIGSDQGNSVSILGLSPGTFTLKVTYFDETGCHECFVNCIVVACDINQVGITFVNAYGSEILKFYAIPPIVGTNTYSYFWTFTFQDGSTSWSYEEKPEVPVYCSNSIISASVVIASALCSVTINVNWSTMGGLCGTYGLNGLRNSNSSVKVYPNPTKSLIFFEGKNLDNYQISIYNDKGTKILESKNLNRINIQDYRKGIYYYTITNSNGYKQSGSLIKD